MIITEEYYNYPLNQPHGYFNGCIVPPFNKYYLTYYTDFIRYLYFMCIMHGEGEYPINLDIKVIEKDCKKKDKRCEPKIKKILIGEAPPPNYANYFYNSLGIWPANGIPFINAPRNVLFPDIVFLTKVDFLIACAQEGFLLLDLFPYSIIYTSKKAKSYKLACQSAFCNPYPINIIATLNSLLCCIEKKIAIGFGLMRFGDSILLNRDCVESFSNWTLMNGITLSPLGPIDILRPVPQQGISKFLRVCGRRGLFGPDANLLMDADF